MLHYAKELSSLLAQVLACYLRCDCHMFCLSLTVLSDDDLLDGCRGSPGWFCRQVEIKSRLNLSFPPQLCFAEVEGSAKGQMPGH